MDADCETASRQIQVEFNEVETDVTAIKWLEIINESSIEQIYEARRDATTNPLDHVFELCCYSWSLSPGQVYKCKIYYRPFVPYSVNVDYFTIVDSTGERAEIRVRGTCIGPVISSSVTRLVMICTSGNCEVKKRIRLVNDSGTTATFMFDVDLVQSTFKVDARHGHVGPHSRQYVTISFLPRKVGTYTCHLPCLILNHKPIVIELYGYCSSVLHKANAQDRFNYPARSKNGFEGYTSDIVVTAQDLPAISLSKSYIDFGQTDKSGQKIPEALCLTNHSQSDVLIKWDQDMEEIFHITPAIAKIPAKQTSLFEVAFNPDRGNNLFARELVGYVFTEQQEDSPREETIIFPTITSVRLIGRSFSACSDIWIPQYEIPHVVIMPPCLPSFPIYTTFMIKTFGHLPLMYRFVPPASSHFIVKPMMGIIYQNNQIIVVGMLPGADNERAYTERWAIRFNGNAKSEYFIDFRGFAECANVSFNDKNIVHSVPTFPGCQEPQQFYMRNITRYAIKYEFVNVPPELQIRNADGEICPNDIVAHDWSFCPTTIGDYEFDVNCILIALREGVPVGPRVHVTLRVLGTCESGFLAATCEELNFGIQAYKATKELSLHVFNSTAANIHYKLTCSQCNWPIRNIEQDVKIHPIADTVPGSRIKTIAVSITPNTPGYYEFIVRYLARLNSNTDALIPNQMPRDICKIRCLCVLPILKVADLQCYGPFPNMNKALLWKLMQVNTLNKFFKDLQPGASETLHINFPPMALHERPVIIKLLLRNATAIGASWNIKRVQICSCRPVAKARDLSFRRNTKYDCLHRKVCSVQPKTGSLQPREENWITLELHYGLLGKTEAKLDLDLGDNRHIFLIMLIESLSDMDNKLHLLNGTRFKFRHIDFGDKDPIYQVCWMHNGTNHSVPFSVKPEDINRKYCYEVFSYETPCTIANPRSCVPILLRFQPRQFGIFKRRLRLTGDEEKELILESSLPCKPAAVGEYVSLRHFEEDEDIPVNFNTDRIDTSYVATHGRVVKMFMMHNNLMQDVLTYEWKGCGVINVEIQARKNLIKSMSVKNFRAIINTEGRPCVIDVNVPREFINTSQRRVYRRSVFKYEDWSRELKGQFTITKEDFNVSERSIKILEKPQPFYKTITIRCSLHNIEDYLLKVDLIKELTSASSREICILKNEGQVTIFEEEDARRASFIIKNLIWKIVNSKLFKNIMQDILQNKPNLFYSQFMKNPYERKELVRRLHISPSWTLISHILEKMLFFILHEEFTLKTAHLIQYTDIRYINYLNMVSEEKRRKTIKRETSLLYRDDTRSRILEYSPSSRISFAL